MSDLQVYRHPTGVAFRGRFGAAVVELYWCTDRGVWLSGPVGDDGAVTYGGPLGLPRPEFDGFGVDEEQARGIAEKWFAGR